jgi:hypothetical protein
MKHSFVVLLFPMLMLGACGYSAGDGGAGGGINVLLTPADGVTQQAIDTEISAEFEDEIEEQQDWASVFTVKKEGAGDNLCTSYNYDADRHIATCLHDDLELDTSYTTLVTGLLAVNGSQAIWRTTDQ